MTFRAIKAVVRSQSWSGEVLCIDNMITKIKNVHMVNMKRAFSSKHPWAYMAADSPAMSQVHTTQVLSV